MQAVLYPRVKWVPAKPTVLISKLTEHQRQTLWRGLKMLDPQQANLIQNDPDFAKLKETFNATVMFSVKDAMRFAEIGRTN